MDKRRAKKPIQEPELTDVAKQVMAKRYLRTDMHGKVEETPGEMFWRVAKHMAKAEIQWTSTDEKGNELNGGAVQYWSEAFFERMVNFKFVCAGKAMFEAGNMGGTGQLSSCFVLPIEDNIHSIFKTLGDAAVVHKNNGGTGFNFSKIRPHGDKVKNVPSASSGPVDFLKAYSAALGQILQGAKRQGANIAILNVDHPDVEEFIRLKVEDGTIKNFNISVGVTGEFMEAVQKNKEWQLKNPRNGTVYRTVKARELFDLIAEHAWKTGDPGLAFLDRLEEDNPTPTIGKIDATNPCITGDARISTSVGLIRFDELITAWKEQDDIKVAVDSRLHSGNAHSPSQVLFTGIKPVFEIETTHGYKVKATADHKIMTENGWKEVRALHSRDKVHIQSRTGLWATETDLARIVHFSCDYPKEYPVKASAELGELLGYFVGDGSVRFEANDSYSYLTFGNDRTELVSHFEKIFSKFGVAVGLRKPGNRSVQLWSHSKKFANFLVDCGVLPVYSALKRVPESIYRMPRETVIGFIRGIFTADGTVNYVKDKSAYVRLSSKSKHLLEDVQLLLINLGIFSKIYNRTRKPRLDLFPEYIRKDGSVAKYSSDGILFELEIAKDQVVLFLKTVGFIADLHKEKLGSFTTKSFYQQQFIDSVSKVTAVGDLPVYDLTEPNTHSFIANGMVVHNCGEIPLLPYESCNLTSIVLTNHLVKDAKGKWVLDWIDMERSIKLGVRFLDDMIEVNTYALDAIRQMVKEGNRRIGLGVMGFAHLLFRMGIPYDSDEAVRLAGQIAKFMRQKAEEASLALAKERGPFPNFDISVYAGTAERYRNCALLMIAPTGTTSLIADSSSGIEPVFSLVTVRRSFNEDSRKNAPTKEFTMADPEFERYLRESFDEKTQAKIKKQVLAEGSLRSVKEIPVKMKRLFTTTHEIAPEWHVKIQAAWQKWIDNSVSKTINFDHTATVEDVKKAYMLGWRLGLKGITIYRDGSKMDQVLNIKGKESKLSKDAHVDSHPLKPATAEKQVCPECGAAAHYADGCVSCPQCGWSKCTM